ncbi:hypothetical protein B2M20_15880 [Nitrobacter vulgaris]|uniref:Uncharacterized protein n=1 Tax=Nitrobacter vulgaris TaxID=29421 RepID=A0A1V4HUW1_NITVU|nr:hypothetical protein B2M20_15880 [Nitrobacter vulgaris]
MFVLRAFGPTAGQTTKVRLGKPLGTEIYVADEANATPLQNYAPQNILALRRASRPLDSADAGAMPPAS